MSTSEKCKILRYAQNDNIPRIEVLRVQPLIPNPCPLAPLTTCYTLIFFLY
jgi:hypothetical protein